MKYDPFTHHRRSIRLKEYDYSQAGMYFVTICAQDRQCLFGKIADDKMVLNDVGKMIEKWLVKLPQNFTGIKIDTYIIMPNHFHAIVVNVGADPRVCPKTEYGEQQQGEHEYKGRHAGLPLQQQKNAGKNEIIVGANPCVCPELRICPVLGTVVQWFKTMTTNEYIRGVKNNNWQPFNKRLWQRNYWEHIIRDEQSYQHIVDYIVNNPLKWQDDQLYAENAKKQDQEK